MPFTIAAPVTATLIGFTTFTPVTGQQVSAPTVETVLFAGTAICTGRALPAVGTTCLILRGWNKAEFVSDKMEGFSVKTEI